MLARQSFVSMTGRRPIVPFAYKPAHRAVTQSAPEALRYHYKYHNAILATKPTGLKGSVSTATKNANGLREHR